MTFFQPLSDTYVDVLKQCVELYITNQQYLIEDMPAEDHAERKQNIAKAIELDAWLCSNEEPFTVSGIYLGTMQGYSAHVIAETPDEAVRETFRRVARDNNFSTDGIDFKNDSRADLENAFDMQMISVVSGHHDELIPC